MDKIIAYKLVYREWNPTERYLQKSAMWATRTEGLEINYREHEEVEVRPGPAFCFTNLRSAYTYAPTTMPGMQLWAVQIRDVIPTPSLILRPRFLHEHERFWSNPEAYISRHGASDSGTYAEDKRFWPVPEGTILAHCVTLLHRIGK